MAFKNPQTGYYYTELVLPGYGRLPRRSLGTKRKADALALEGAIREVHRRGLLDPRLFGLLDALAGRGHGRPGALGPAELLVATRSPSPAEALDALLRRLNDPPLAAVVEAVAAQPGVTREDRLGLPKLLNYAEATHGAGCPVSVLAEAGAAQALLEAVEAGEEKKRNSVIRYEKRALSKLLARHYGRAERDRIMKGVRFEGTDDQRRLREAVVTPEAIRRLCDELDAGRWSEGDEAASLYVRIAAATGAEIRPLSETRNAGFHPTAGGGGMLYLAGTKRIRGKAGRDREVLLTPPLAERVAAFARPDAPGAFLFPLRWSRFWSMFQKARRRAGLMEAVLDGDGNPTPIRPHDLRGVFAAFAERAGVPRTKISVAGLGHQQLNQTDRYLLRETALTAAEAARVAAELGL